MKIGELAAEAGCDVQTIRFYERSRLLLAPPRTASNYRMYGPEQLERLRFIRRCRAVDMSLGDIRTLLAAIDRRRGRDGVYGILDEHLDKIRARMEELAVLERDLKALRRRLRR